MTSKRSGWLDAVQIIAALAVAVCLVPAGAHLAELANKMRLSDADYMTVQNIYRGWALFGIPIFTALAALFVHTILVRHSRRAVIFSLIALLCIVATQAIFWTYTYPMNALTRNWTVTPSDLDAARQQWEISHAVNAGLTFLAFATLMFSILESRPLVKSAA